MTRCNVCGETREYQQRSCKTHRNCPFHQHQRDSSIGQSDSMPIIINTPTHCDSDSSGSDCGGSGGD